MTTPLLFFLVLCAGFFIEEFLLIKPVSTIAGSDPLSRRLELLSIWVPAVGIAASGATIGMLGSLRGSGVVNAVGLALGISGLVLRYWSRAVLGRFFTIGV